jgi:hypothetical protein
VVLAMGTPDLVFRTPLSHWEFAWYAIGWLVWTPSYVVALYDMFWGSKGRNRPCLIPTIAVCGNVAFEGVWFFLGDFTHAGLIRWLYLGAFVLDLPILVGVLIYGRFGTPRRYIQGDCHYRFGDAKSDTVRHWVVVLLILVGWIAAFVALRFSYEVPLGSVGAYIDNTVMSGLFVLAVWLAPDTPKSKWLAWSKFLGTFFVTIFVGLRYHGSSYASLYFLAAVSTVFDVWFVLLAHFPRPPSRRADDEEARYLL